MILNPRSPLTSFFLSFLYPSCCLIHYFSFNHSSFDIRWCHPALILRSITPSLISHPSSPACPHPFYCKLCDWQLQLQVLRWAFTSAAWLSKNLTLPPASTPISTTGLSPSNRLQVRPKKRHPNHLQGLRLDTVCASKGELAPVCFISEAEWTWDCAKT